MNNKPTETEQPEVAKNSLRLDILPTGHFYIDKEDMAIRISTPKGWFKLLPENVSKLVEFLQSPPAPTKAGEEFMVSFVFEHPESKERKESRMYTPLELLDESLYEIQEKACMCDCQPVGETNVVECNCQDYTDDFEYVATNYHTAALSTKEAEIARLKSAIQTILTNVSTNDEWTPTADLVHFIEKTLNPHTDDKK